MADQSKFIKCPQCTSTQVTMTKRRFAVQIKTKKVTLSIPHFQCRQCRKAWWKHDPEEAAQIATEAYLKQLKEEQ